MDSFKEASLRLKQALGLEMDKDVADALGMTKRSWAGRKVSGKFPEKELRALAQRRPELGIDVDYVLTGLKGDEIQSAVSGISERIRSMRGVRSVEDMAAEADVTPDKWVAAERGAHDAEFIKQIITCMDVDPVWLLMGESQQLSRELDHMEVALVENYRRSSAEAQDLMRRMAVLSARSNSGRDENAAGPAGSNRTIQGNIEGQVIQGDQHNAGGTTFSFGAKDKQ